MHRDETQVPLRLWQKPHWKLGGALDSELFFRHLLGTFVDATSLYIEGTSLSGDVEAFYRKVTSFLYAGDEPLIEYPDAFLSGSTIYVSRSADDEAIRKFAFAIGALISQT